MKKTINFNEMNLYVRHVQHVEVIDKLYYLPWRIIYDNFLLFVDSGSVTLKFENQEIVFYENELCIIPPFLKNKLEVHNGQHSWYYGVHFDFFYDDSESFNEDVYIAENLGYVKAELTEMPIDEKLAQRNAFYPDGIQFPQKIFMHDNVRFRELFERLLNQSRSDNFGHEIIAKSVFYEMFYMIVREITNTAKEENEEDEAVYRYLQNLTGKNNDQVTMAQIALEYGMSQKRFREIFKKTMQMTPKSYSIEKRLLKAKELLETGKYKVNEVAYMCGYDDVFYFSKLFKKKEGISPKNYVANCKKALDTPQNAK